MDEGIWVNTAESGRPDGCRTAALLAAAAATVEDAALLLCSEGSSDDAAILGWPVLSSVTSFSVEGGVVTAERKLEDCIQTVSAPLPAVLCLLPEAAPAPIPGLKQVMAARKKPVAELSAEALVPGTAAGLKDLGSTGYVSTRKNILINEDSKEQTVAALVAALKKEGAI